MDRGAWWAIVHRVAKSPTQLKWHITHTERWKWSPPSSHWGRCYVVPLNIVQEAHGWPFERWPKQSDTPTGIKFIAFLFTVSFPPGLLASVSCLPCECISGTCPNLASAFLCSNIQKTDSGLARLLHLASQTGLDISPWLPSKGPTCSKFQSH